MNRRLRPTDMTAHQTTNRGPGDPGSRVFLALLAAGYAGVEP